MKQTFIVFLFIMALSVVSAQSSPRTQNAKTKAKTESKTSTSEHQAKAEVVEEVVVVNKEDVTKQNFTTSPAISYTSNTTLIFKDGQTATPSGHDAMAMGSGYSFFKKAVEKRLITNMDGSQIPNLNSFRDHTNAFMLNGQIATPSGHEATSVNGGYASFGRKNTWNVPQNNNSAESSNERDPADNQTIYKKNGQAATKTGHEATGMGSGYSFSKKDK